jgi:putative chitinase
MAANELGDACRGLVRSPKTRDEEENMITKKQLLHLLPDNKNPDQLVMAFNILFPKYEINTRNRIAGFLAQCGHESLDFTILKENLNYSAEGLRRVFPKYFPTLESAQPYNRKPEKIANRVYGNRLGNGPEESGDGYKFRGRGAIQLTGRNNYQAFATTIGKNIDETIAYCETLQGAIESACWYWERHALNDACDDDDILHMTKLINGGRIGLGDRKSRYERAKGLLP